MKIGIFGGSFDPIHSGHAIIINYLSRIKMFDEILIMVNRKNPIKKNRVTTPDKFRLEMANFVADKFDNVKVSDFEFSLPYPSYSINTLRALRERCPGNEFKMIIGSDNWNNFEMWKEGESIIKEFGVVVYPRPDNMISKNLLQNVIYLGDAPLIKLSSTEIRDLISENGNISFLVPEEVENYIHQNKLYKK